MAPTRSTPQEWLVFLALGIAWGSSYLFIKIGVETLTPLTLVASGSGSGWVLAPVMAVARRSNSRSRAMVYGHLVVMALVGIALPFFLITWASYIGPALAAILNGTVPLFAIVLAAAVLMDEPTPSTASSACWSGSPAWCGPDQPDPVGKGIRRLTPAEGRAGAYRRIAPRRRQASTPGGTCATCSPPCPALFLEVSFAFLITAGRIRARAAAGDRGRGVDSGVGGLAGLEILNVRSLNKNYIINKMFHTNTHQ